MSSFIEEHYSGRIEELADAIFEVVDLDKVTFSLFLLYPSHVAVRMHLPLQRI